MEQLFQNTAYFDLKRLAIYSSCSVRWLRDRLVDRNHPLPSHRVEGKLLIKREDFDQWMATFRQCPPPDELDRLADGVLATLLHHNAS